jgi:hypothetical protein
MSATDYALSFRRGVSTKPAPADADEELIALCAEWLENYDDFHRLCEANNALEGAVIRARKAGRKIRKPEPIDTDGLSLRGGELVDEIVGIPARTPVGLRAKAEVLMANLCPGAEEESPGPCVEDQLTWSVVQDILRGAAARSPARPARRRSPTPCSWR